VTHIKPYALSSPEFGKRPDIPIRKRRDYGKDDWEVIKITRESLRRWKGSSKKIKLYQAIWKINGLEQETDEWVPARDFQNAPEVLAQWKATLKLHPEKQAT
jgi:hypothetical protein